MHLHVQAAQSHELGVKISVAITRNRCKVGQLAIHARAGNPMDAVCKGEERHDMLVSQSDGRRAPGATAAREVPEFGGPRIGRFSSRRIDFIYELDGLHSCQPPF